MSLKEQVALVTGGARGIGRGIARHLATAGASVVVADLDAASAQEAARELETMGAAALAIAADVTREDAVITLIKTALDRLGRLDVLVNNVGAGQRVVWTADLELAEWERMLSINLTSAFLCSKHAARHMMAQGHGRIISIASINALGGFPLVAAYNAAKWGMIGLTKTLANELGPYRITVNAICPGPTDTDFQRANVAQRARILGISEDVYRDRITQMTPLRRWTTPDDLGAVVAFLASEAAAHITGAVIPVTGGMDLLGGVPPAWPAVPFPEEAS